MCAICASFSLAPSAKTIPDAQSAAAASAAVNLIDVMLILPVTATMAVRRRRHWMRHQRGGSRDSDGRAQDRENVIRHAFAARAGEGEDAGQCGSDLTFEIGTQHEPRAMQPGLYSTVSGRRLRSSAVSSTLISSTRRAT